MPGAAVHVRQGLHVGFAEEEVHRLRLVDPFLASRRCVDQGFKGDAEGGDITILELARDFVDSFQFAVKVLHLVDNLWLPKADPLEIVDEERIHHHEVAREIALGEHVLVHWLDAG